MAIISNIRALSGAGVLANRAVRTPTLSLRRYNLIYGFNGSGKSTLSRLFASLQSGNRDGKLPPACAFEFELDDGAILGCPDKLTGLEQRVLVFNADFVEHNLQWATGTANPVFYIGREQAELAAELARQEAAVPAAHLRRTNANALLKAKEKAFATFKRERARLVAENLRLRNRKYEAPQLVQDFGALDLGPDANLTEEQLEAAKATCRLDEPMARVNELAFQDRPVVEAISQARELAARTPGTVVIAELSQHPDMVLWVKEGAAYHTAHDLETCLFCTGPIQPARRELLERAFDDKLERFLELVGRAHADGEAALSALADLRIAVATLDAVSVEFRQPYKETRERLIEAIKACERLVAGGVAVLADKKGKPTQRADAGGLASETDVAEAVAALMGILGELNGLLRTHNERIDGFDRYQEEARIAVRRHYLVGGRTEYDALVADHKAAENEATSAEAALTHLTQEVARLKSEVREHGPAADKINKLIESYLGHGELTISAVAEGYEIHRHGRLVEGTPSEGEKTAIALCYFISTLESDGRKLKDLIVVVDDPISSLDTKALNFACALVKSRLDKAGQLFVLTHNQQCMNEFKKAWKSRHRPIEKDKDPTATFLFMDVTIPKGGTARSASLVEMSKLLRDYDFEYHFLFHHVLKFEAETDAEFEYAYMMPNVLRRVLDVFLAFRCPGSAGLAPKIAQLCAEFTDLDQDRITALERLAQVESHSENLDDLIGFSSMTLEETQDANATLLEMMQIVDPAHLAHLRRICA